ncbi:SDR family NAD(P)-dependent oxidoreductase [Secundilactobacillus collinoides]|uniref:SDR family NAD(P)-dependent oxidoreductase n=1 Tax=Secundilactobacillus collinoides TaxID=33960 RepID=UPI000A64FBF3|nr:SDR family NAD(P)-dependent oxidoreductase [Secundilactobacillus collinoides]
MTFDKNSFSLAGKVALITGGARGIGQFYSIALSKYGADIFVVSASQKGWEDTTQKVEANGQKVAFFTTRHHEPGCC